jgi:hypothetical protein
MTIPSVQYQKTDFQTGVAPASDVGICAIIAAAGSGPVNAPAFYTVDSQALSDFGPSRLAEYASYMIQQTGLPVILIRPTTSVAASYGTIVTSMTGTSVPTAGAATPNDDYDVLVTFTTGGTIGTTGIVFNVSYDGGNSPGLPVALGTSTTLTCPNFPQGGSPGVSFSMAAGTIVAGDSFRVIVAGPKMSDTDLSTSLEALRTYAQPWECVLVSEEIASTTPALVDAWLTGLEGVGRFRIGVLNTRFKNQLHLGTGTAETESAYATAIGTIVAGATNTIRCIVGVDGGDVVSTLTGVRQARPTSLAIAARMMKISLGVDPAYIGGGVIGNFAIVDSQGKPKYHNEENYPNFDGLSLSTMRTFQAQGVYITNAHMFSLIGSDYVIAPQARTMNQACEIGYAILGKQLGLGVGKKPKDPKTGAVYMLDSDRMMIEGLVNPAVDKALINQVSDSLFALSKTDDIGSNAGAKVTGTQQVVSLAYIKDFSIVAAFTRSITVSL